MILSIKNAPYKELKGDAKGKMASSFIVLTPYLY